MSLEGFTDDLVESLKNKLIEKVVALAPEIIKQLTPIIITLTTDAIQSHLNDIDSMCPLQIN